jgi:hypothetical protein
MKEVMPVDRTKPAVEIEGDGASSHNTHPSPFLHTEPVSESTRHAQVETIRIIRRTQSKLP